MHSTIMSSDISELFSTTFLHPSFVFSLTTHSVSLVLPLVSKLKVSRNREEDPNLSPIIQLVPLLGPQS